MPSDDFWSDLPGRSRRTPKIKVRSMTPSKTDEEPEPKVTDEDEQHIGFATIISTVVLMIIGAVLGFGLVGWQFMRVAADDRVTDPQVVEISRGARTIVIAKQLETDGLIPSRWPLLGYLTLTHASIRAGTYSLSPAMTTQAIAHQLTSGEVASHQVTIPEGWRIEQIADLLDKTGIVTRTDFLQAATYDPVRYTLPDGVQRQPGQTLEGLLFPDTYRFAYGTTSKQIVSEMLANYSKRTADLKPTYAQLILASIIEREDKSDGERAKIAGVYQNRLKTNLRLQADPTVQYAKDSSLTVNETAQTNFKWWGPITADDYQKVKSVYNTYLNLGLPPTPISNPGLASLQAAVQPTEHKYYYFFHTADGTTIYSKTLDEHNQNKKKFGVSNPGLSN